MSHEIICERHPKVSQINKIKSNYYQMKKGHSLKISLNL